MADKKSSKKKQLLAFAVCSVIALGVCFGVLVFTVNSLENNKTSVAEYETKSKTDLKGETPELLKYINSLTEKTQDNKFIKVNTYMDVFVDDNSIVINNGNESDKNILVYAKNKMMGTVDGYYGEDYIGRFGKIYKSMPLVDLKEATVEKSTFSVGLADENGNSVYDSDSGELIDANSYYISFFINPKNADSVGDLFNLNDSEKISKKLVEDLNDVCKLSKTDLLLESLKITAKINRLTDEIEYIIFEKSFDISANTEFINDYSVLGKKNISFRYTVQEKYEYFYSGISFSETAVTVKPDSEAALSVGAVIEDDSDYTVKFTSSDNTVATVDEMGYVKGIKASEKPVTITVSLDYLGKTFTDTCTVTVGDTDNKGGVDNE